MSNEKLSLKDLERKLSDDNVGLAITVQHVKFEREGQVLIGRLADIKRMESKKYSSDYNMYILLTPEGTKSCILGAIADNVISAPQYLGKILYIKFKGKITLEDGRTANAWTIKDVTRELDTLFPKLEVQVIPE